MPDAAWEWCWYWDGSDRTCTDCLVRSASNARTALSAVTHEWPASALKLSAAESHTFRAVAEALLGTGVALDAGAAVQPMLVHLSPTDARLLRVLLHTFEYLVPITHGHTARFSTLPAEVRGAIVRSWTNSRLPIKRKAVAGLKTLAAFAHYARPAQWPELGYDGPWLGRFPVAIASRTDARRFVMVGREASADIRLSAQICVIGTGAGGAAALAHLASIGIDTVGIEAGPLTTAADFTQQELEMLPLLYQQGGLRATANQSIGILQGRGVGGSTLHNTGLVYSPPPGIVERWRAEYGFEIPAVELEHRVEWIRSVLGATPVPLDQINRNNALLRAGAEALGWRYRIADHNRLACSGCGYCMLGCAYNRKNNAALTLIPAALAAGARLLSDARVVAVENAGESKRVHCQFVDGQGKRTGRKATIEASIVLLAAGALDTPALLQRSGFANAKVGRGLHLHPAAVVCARFAEPVVGWRGVPQSIVVEQFASFMSDGHGGFLFIPGASHFPGMTAAVLAGVGPNHRERMLDYAKLASAAVVLHDEASGRVVAARNGEPVAHYWPSRRDLAEIRRGVGELARLYLEAGADRVYLPYADAAPVHNTTELANALAAARSNAHQIALNSVHPQSSCPLGSNRGSSACRPDGEVWDRRGVYVCDTSLFPTSVGVPPQVTAMALGACVAARAAERIKGRPH